MFRTDENACTGCAACMNICPANAIYIIDYKAYIDENRCNGCGQCANICPQNAIHEKEIAWADRVPLKTRPQSAAASGSSSAEHRPFLTLIHSIFEDFFEGSLGGVKYGSKRFGRARRGRRGRCGRRT